LIEFAPDAPVGLHRFFRLKADLEQLLAISVCLVEASAVRNPYVLADINGGRGTIYG
jgi:predicted nucleotidyltransferase